MIILPKLGSWVSTKNYGYTGLITSLSIAGDSDDEWFDSQSIPVTEEQRNGIWVSVLVHGGGAVLVALDEVTEIAPIEGFHHSGDDKEVIALCPDVKLLTLV